VACRLGLSPRQRSDAGECKREGKQDERFHSVIRKKQRMAE
jgi:hypothetical protein